MYNLFLVILTVYCCILNVIAKTLQYTINYLLVDSNFTNSPPYQIEGKEIKDSSKLLAEIFSSNREIYGFFFSNPKICIGES